MYLKHWIFRPTFWEPHCSSKDRLCIAQHDMALKEQGIRGLGSFLEKSQNLTILWSGGYFSRLSLVKTMEEVIGMVKETSYIYATWNIQEYPNLYIGDDLSNSFGVSCYNSMFIIHNLESAVCTKTEWSECFWVFFSKVMLDFGFPVCSIKQTPKSGSSVCI